MEHFGRFQNFKTVMGIFEKHIKTNRRNYVKQKNNTNDGTVVKEHNFQMHGIFWAAREPTTTFSIFVRKC